MVSYQAQPSCLVKESHAQTSNVNNLRIILLGFTGEGLLRGSRKKKTVADNLLEAKQETGGGSVAMWLKDVKQGKEICGKKKNLLFQHKM